MSRVLLPVADTGEVRRYAWRTALRRRRELAGVLALHGLAACCGLAAPRLVGVLVEEARRGAGVAAVDRPALLLLSALVAQAVLLRFAVLAASRLGEAVLAELREDFVDRVLELPPATVERTGTGDLLTRSSRDVAELSDLVRFAVPETLIAVVTCALTVGALALTGPVLLLPCLVAVPLLVISSRWYLRRARDGYLRQNAAYAGISEALSETVEGARTVEALRLAERRHRRTDRAIAESWAANRYTLYLRCVWYPAVEFGYLLPLVATLAVGGWYLHSGWVTLGQLTAGALYVQQLVNPLDTLLSWMDRIQVGSASLARLLGVAEREPVPAGGGTQAGPGAVAAGSGDERVEARAVRYAYASGRDVLHGVDLAVAPGERIAVVGPSGAGKSTLGRLLAGVYRPRTGTVRIGGVDVERLPAADLRTHVALVTQEHHVFRGTVRENLTLPRPEADDAAVRAALETVGAWEWVAALPHGLQTMVGSAGHPLSPAQAQQLALARLVLADPHTLVLDEATSLLDPTAARQLERSLAAVLRGRTVIAIAHRLHTAQDADRIAVVDGGRIAELGSHRELIAAGGAYAALWESWHGGAG